MQNSTNIICDTDLDFLEANRRFYFTSVQLDERVGIFGCQGPYAGFVAQTDDEICLPVSSSFINGCTYWHDDLDSCRRCQEGQVPVLNTTTNITSCSDSQKDDFTFEHCTNMYLNSTNRTQGYCFQCEEGKVLDWTSNKCLDTGTIGVEGCIIQDSDNQICKECDVDSGYYMTYNEDTKKMECKKTEKVEGGCQKNCIMCDKDSQRCNRSYRAPFDSAYKVTTKNTFRNMNSKCNYYKWKYGRSYCTQCAKMRQAPAIPGDDSTCGNPKTPIDNCEIYGSSELECIECEGGLIVEINKLMDERSDCVIRPVNQTRVEHCTHEFKYEGLNTMQCSKCKIGYVLNFLQTTCTKQTSDQEGCSSLNADGSCKDCNDVSGYSMMEAGKCKQGLNTDIITNCNKGCIDCGEDHRCKTCYKTGLSLKGSCESDKLQDKNCLRTSIKFERTVCISCLGDFVPDFSKESACKPITKNQIIEGCEGYGHTVESSYKDAPVCDIIGKGDLIVEEKDSNNDSKVVQKIQKLEKGEEIPDCEMHIKRDSVIQCQKCLGGFAIQADKISCLKNSERHCFAVNKDGDCLACDVSKGYYAFRSVDESNICELSSSGKIAMVVGVISLVGALFMMEN